MYWRIVPNPPLIPAPPTKHVFPTPAQKKKEWGPDHFKERIVLLAAVFGSSGGKGGGERFFYFCLFAWSG